MKGSVACFVLLLVVALCVEARKPRALGCGYVHDGRSDRVDLDVQTSTSSLSARWFGFDGAADTHTVKEYEACVISHLRVTDTMMKSDANERCSENQPFEGKPDVHAWVKVGRDLSHTFNNLELSPKSRYYIVVKSVFNSGNTMFSSTDGIYISSDAGQGPNHISLQELEATVTAVEETVPSTRNTTPREIRDVSNTDQLSCAVDVLNACRRGRIGVGAFLTEVYGPPVWNLEDTNRNVLIALPSRESSTGLTEGDRAGIAVGVIVFFLLIVLVAALLIFAKGRRKSNKFQTVLYRDENLELEDGVEYKQQRQTEKDSVSSQSKVIFPEMKIRRLSQGDARPIYDEEEQAAPGKRQHPALEVQSSSLRDYRQQ